MKLKNIFISPLNLKEKIGHILSSKKSNEEIFEEVEELLILSDISSDLVMRILENTRKKSRSLASFTKDGFFNLLKEEIKAIFYAIPKPSPEADVLFPSKGKNIIVLVGINGSGKTTSAAKLAHYYRDQGKKVLMSAADTFRAAGSSQLSLWGERMGIPVIGGDRGADPGSVVFNSLSSFNSKDYDLLIIDTAGRVQTRENLMKELEKLTKIIKKFHPDGPTETLLVIDATMGQNTLDQAKKFKEFSGISGIFLAKLDGTAKGGTVINIVNEMRIPVKFVGTGEKQDDIVPFSVDDFIASILND